LHGENYDKYPHFRDAGLCPSLRYHLPSEISLQSKLQLSNGNKGEKQFNIKAVKDTEGNIIYLTIQLGEYPKTKANENLSRRLESLYNEGDIKEGLVCTGRWYSTNGQKKEYKDYAGKHSPEFEYKGKRYVRVVSCPSFEDDKYSDGTLSGNEGTIRWAKVEPVSFVIKNWDEMPKSINSKGNGKAEYFDLKAEEAITSNIPFYPNADDQNRTFWQNSTIRGFFNGIDVRNIQENGNVEYGANRGGNFTGKCNFLNEAFNLSREPIVEYTIPDSETEIPDDAFNGCITLKKIVLHSGIKSIGKNAFEGLKFKYAYKTKIGELILSQELPKDKDEYEDILELNKTAKSFDGFDYNILVKSDKLDEVNNFSDFLSKNNFVIPYGYGLALIKSAKAKSFCENSYFNFFKNEFPEINDILLNFSEEERIDFFKFANSLGCFSTEKILDKNGKETEVPLAQKASSLLVKLLKTDELRLRKISRFIWFNAT